MTQDSNNRPISANEIEAFARQGVERAIAARGEITELTTDQMQDVSGGLSLGGLINRPIGRPMIFGFVSKWPSRPSLPARF